MIDDGFLDPDADRSDLGACEEQREELGGDTVSTIEYCQIFKLVD